ncbi:MAG: rRNA pseudouridine synthase [Coriobacteriia bacterium]|nr:rRNA pseudouridine synthase [Coriobacteriia bacterium]
MRLQKFLSRAGVASRRGSEDLMTAGRVSVNQEVVRELGSKVDPKVDIVTVDGRVVSLADSHTYIMLNKPVGVLTTMDDPHGRSTVASLVADADQSALFPVGRLDKDTSGLLLFTTDGDLAHRILHPKFKLFKTYEVVVQGTLGDSALDALRQGIQLKDGITAPAKADYADGVLTLQIREGRNRQVRRMCKAVGHPVERLHRTQLGSLSLDSLASATWRHLAKDELAVLRQSTAQENC